MAIGDIAPPCNEFDPIIGDEANREKLERRHIEWADDASALPEMDNDRPAGTLKDGAMGRARIRHSRTVYVLPADFPERLKAIQKQSGLPWAEIARRIGTYPYTVWRWYEGGVRPHYRHQMALLELADELGLSHLLTSWTLPDESESATSAEVVPPRGRSPGGKAPRERGRWDRRG